MQVNMYMNVDLYKCTCTHLTLGLRCVSIVLSPRIPNLQHHLLHCTKEEGRTYLMLSWHRSLDSGLFLDPSLNWSYVVYYPRGYVTNYALIHIYKHKHTRIHTRRANWYLQTNTIHKYKCMCVCVCVRERERERGRDIERDTERIKVRLINIGK